MNKESAVPNVSLILVLITLLCKKKFYDLVWIIIILPRKLDLTGLKIMQNGYFQILKIKISFFHDDTKNQLKNLFQKFALNAEHQCASKRNQFLKKNYIHFSNNS